MLLTYFFKLKSKVEAAKGIWGKVSADMPKNIQTRALFILVRADQTSYFPEIVEYFSQSNVVKSKIPNLVLQLNLFMDSDLVIRVKGKFNNGSNCPIILHYNSHVTKILIKDLHRKFSHAGVFTTLRELRFLAN